MTESDGDPAFQAFTDQARKCEAFAAAQPEAYRWRVVVLAVFGYIFPPAVMFTLVAVFAVLVGFYVAGGHHGGFVLIGKFGLALGVLILMVGRAMWPSFSKPDGVRLHRSDAPEFFSFIDAVRRKAGNPKVDGVYVTDEMNAAVAQTPRLGLFGWHRNDLILGLPLIQALTREELAAVVAHEFGHLSGAHGKRGAWIYRSRLLMARILSSIEEKSYFGSWIFRWFYRWYAPYFAAYSFALAREQEYEADRMAASVVSQQVIIDALARVSLAGHYIGRTFWHEVWGAADREAVPPEQVYGRLGTALRSLPSWEGTAPCFEAELARATDYTDTHPSLSDRARALDAQPRLPPATDESAASLLPDNGADLVDRLSRQWQMLAGENWDDNYKETQQQRQLLAELDAGAEGGALPEDDALNRGFLAERFLSPEAALERFDQALAWFSEADAALFAKGRILLDLGRDEGLTCLDGVMDKNQDAIVPGCELAEAYLSERERTAEAEAYRRRREAHEQLLQEDWNERRRVNRSDNFVSHRCDVEKIDDIVSAIGGFKGKGLKRAWLVRKVTTHRQWEPAYVLVCEIGSYKRWTEDMDELQSELSQPLAAHDDISVAVCDVDDSWLRDKAMEVPDARIYPQA